MDIEFVFKIGAIGILVTVISQILSRAGREDITGNIDFYGKSGFVVASTKGIRYADADPDDTVVPYFLIKELETGFLDSITGTYHDPESYFVAERDPEGFEAFEARFPPKEKKKLPGQIF